MAININTYREILKHLDEIITANEPTQPIPIFKSFAAMVAHADKNLDGDQITFNKAVPPRTPATMLFSAKKPVAELVQNELKPTESILKKAAPKKPILNSEPFFESEFDDNEFNSGHESSHEEDSFDILANHPLDEFSASKEEHIAQKESALDKIKKMRDNIQFEYNIIVTLSSDEQKTTATYLRMQPALNKNQTTDNFFKDLKDLKQLIKQIPLNIKAKKSDMQLFANSGLRLIAKLEKYSADYNEYLAKPVPPPFDLEPTRSTANLNDIFDINTDNTNCYDGKCRLPCTIM